MTPALPHRLFRRLGALVFLLLAAAPAAAQGGTVSGWFHLVWQVAGDPDVPVEVDYLLTDDAGRTHRLDLAQGAAEPHGGVMALDRRRVTAVVSDLRALTAEGEPALRVISIQPASGPSAQRAPSTPQGALQSGSKAYVTILCRFADSTAVTPHPLSYYQNLLTGSAYPGLDHYWREVSDGRVNLTGSRVVGWYDLPLPRASYFPRGANADPDWDRMVADCTGAADAEVDFRLYSGVNLQFNTYMFASWGGTAFHTRDGVNGLLPTTWMAPWAGHSVYAHEMGHSFGLPHSSGPYAATYDSKWDVMSNAATLRNPAYDDYIGQHTMIWHKDILGWVPASRKYVPAPGSERTLVLERSAHPSATADPLMVQVPIPYAPGQFYTIETRHFDGYDAVVPGKAVVIHRVLPSRADRAAQVVDPDGNGNPNDAGAMWLPGETFTDLQMGLSVRVDAATATGFQVTVTLGQPLTVVVAGPGTVSGSGSFGPPCSVTCTRALPLGTAVTLTAAPLAGTAFRGWSGACSGTGTCTVTMNTALSVTATFGSDLAVASEAARPAGAVDAPYADTLRATGGSGYSWAVVGGALPPGLTLGAEGAVSGTPTQAGIFNFTAQVMAGFFTQSRAFWVTVHPAVTITSAEQRRVGLAGVAYADTLSAGGGTGTYAWEVVGGALPPGLALGAATGVVSGTPTAAGSFSFAVRAGSGPAATTRAFSLAVVTPPEPTAVVEQLLGNSAALSDDQRRYLDQVGNRNGRVDVGDVRAWLVENRQINPDQVPGLREILGTPPGAVPADPSQPKKKEEVQR